MAQEQERALAEYAFNNTVASLRHGDILVPSLSGVVEYSSGEPLPRYVTMGCLTMSSDIRINDSVVTLYSQPNTSTAPARRGSTVREREDAEAERVALAYSAAITAHITEAYATRSGSASDLTNPYPDPPQPITRNSLLHIITPNANAPLQTFDLFTEVMFFRHTDPGEDPPPTLGAGISIEYGPDDASGMDSIQVEASPGDSTGTRRRPFHELNGALTEHVLAGTQDLYTLGLNVTILANDTGITTSVLHNGTELVPDTVSQASAAIIGPALDVWLGIDLSVTTDPNTLQSMMTLSLASVPLTPPIPLPNWQPLAGWTFRVRGVGDPMLGTRVYKFRVISGSMDYLSYIRMLVAVGPLFVSPTSDFAFFTPPVVMDGGIVPTSGPIYGGTNVRITVSNYSQTIGNLPETHINLKCRFGSDANAVSTAATWADANDTKAGVDCVAPPSVFGAGPVSLQISANGQQYTHAGGYMYYEEPVYVAVTPRSAPVNGGALLTFRGDNLYHGSDYSCRIGGVVVPATHDAYPDRVQCLSPNTTTADHPPGLTSAPLALALNSQQFVPLTVENGSFAFYAHPEVLEATPLDGPVNGGTVVEVYSPSGGLGAGFIRTDEDGGSGEAGSGSGEDGSGGSGEAGSGEGGSGFPAGRRLSSATVAGGTSSANSSVNLQYGCSFGHIHRTAADGMLVQGVYGVVRATILDDYRIRCVSPNAEHAGAADMSYPLIDGGEPDCVDDEPLREYGVGEYYGPANPCEMWASQGECERNERFMKKQCRKSCRFCVEGEQEEASPDGQGPNPIPRL